MNARALASWSTDPSVLSLVDSREMEVIEIDVPVESRPGFALVNTRNAMSAEPTAEADAKRRTAVLEILKDLRASGFPGLHSIREIEHRDQGRAIDAVSRRHRSLLNYLVTENGRVQKLVFAAQHRDWQMFGALLMMSHASRASDMGMGDAACDFVVSEVENMSLDGMYGATRIDDRCGAMLLTGQPFSVPPALDALTKSFEERFPHSLTTTLL